MIDQPKSVAKLTVGSPVKTQAGDFFLIHRTNAIAKMIVVGQRLRFTKEEAYWNHCGVFLDDQGTIAEALTHKGVTKGNISKYTGQEYIVVNIHASDEDRQQMVKFAEWAFNTPYGFTTDVSLAFWCLLGGKFNFSLDGQMICSGLVARTLERAGYIFSRDPSREMPADLARHFQVHKNVL